MYCSQCGMELPDWALFCERCGARVVRPSAGDGETDGQHPSYDAAAELAHATNELVHEATPSYDMPTSVLAASALSAAARELADEREAADEPGGEPAQEPAPVGSDGDSAAHEAAHLSDQDDGSAATAPQEGPVEAAVTEATDESSDDEPAAVADGDDELGAAGDEVPDLVEDEYGDGMGTEPDLEPLDVSDELPVRDPNSPFDVVSHDELHQGLLGLGDNVSLETPHVSTMAHHRTYHRAEERSTGPSMALIAGVATAAMVFIFFMMVRLLGFMDRAQSTGETTQVAGSVVTRSEAAQVIASLDGWWKTGRALDGRYWHIEGTQMSAYAADGKLASEKTLDVRSVERMSTGPGGIEKAGYYLRDVGYYLADDDPDMLYALAQDGSADEDGNLIRTDAPPFAGGTDEEAVVEEAAPVLKTEEYILPEADTRVYDPADLEVLTNYELFVARYEIFARHGCIFLEGGDLAAYFASKSWYQPDPNFNDEQLTDIEQQNMEVIRQVEASRNSEWAGV